MEALQHIAAPVYRGQTGGTPPAKTAPKAAAAPGDRVEFSDTGLSKANGGRPGPTLMAPATIPQVEEIKQKLQYNGYPYKSDIYKSIVRLVGSDLN